MDRLPLAPSSILADALTVVGAAVGIGAFLGFVCLDVLLQGLLTALGGPANRRETFPEFGPVAYPVISEPAPRGATSSEAKREEGRSAARPHLWRYLAGGSSLPPPSPSGSGQV